MSCVYELWPSADMSVPETQPNQGFANRALPVMYLSTANSGQVGSRFPAATGPWTLGRGKGFS